MTLRTTTLRRRLGLLTLLAVSTTAVAVPTAAQAFNPQPDPPRIQVAFRPAFNPQPDPPGRS